MQDRRVIRRLFRLANRISSNAEKIRNARLPHHLKRAKALLLRHLKEINHIKDAWSDTHKPSRRLKFPRPSCACDSSHWWPGRRYFSR